ncbi:MAG: NUDIX domain-containing protein [Alphaproteobacteria bacterium]|nr:NUDIX domain-containing protein [Alphaproteobacteria bacterium]
MSTLPGRIVGSSIYAYQRVMRMTRVGRWPLTIGVRIIVRDGEDRVLLVRHTYTPGWHFPGGAIDRRETAVDAAVRELREEALVEATSPPRLVGVFLSTTNRKSDHIVLFEAGDWRRIAGKARPLEIAETGFFPIRDLPKGTTGGTRRRLAELLGEAEAGASW